jgi:hypothetical protein
MIQSLKLFLVAGLFLISSSICAQEFRAIVLDSLNQSPVPFASIYLKSGSGAIANEEGQFRLPYQVENIPNDTLYISCMGYKTLKYAVDELQDSLFFLPPKVIALNSVILTNKQLSADQILTAIQENIPDKYELGVTEKKLFLRETGNQEFKKLNIKIKKSSIAEFNQNFWDSILKKIPRKNTSFAEFAGRLYGDFSAKNQKLQLFKALELEDKKATALFENTEALFDTILKKNIKSTSYFKVRSGLIGGKLEGDAFQSEPRDTLTVKEKEQKRKAAFLKQQKEQLTQFLKTLFKDEEFNLMVLIDSSKYIFKVVDLTYFGSTPVYILTFEPKRNAAYAGRLFIDADRLALLRLEYKNIKNIRDFSLLGVSFKQDIKEVILQFKKMTNGKYSLEYFEYTTAFEGGFERPLVITEKNKVVKGRNKQNELKMDLEISTRIFEKYQLVVFETTPVSETDFDAFVEKPNVLPENLPVYDPTFWDGYSIIEPNKAIKSFKIRE